MVQIKAVLRNFLPKKYEIAFNRRTTPDSFKSAVKFNATIAIFLLVIQFLGAPNILSQKDSSWWEYLYIIEGIIFGSVIFDGFFGYCFVTKDSLGVQRFTAVTVFALGGFISPAMVIATFCLISPTPWNAFLVAMGISLFTAIFLLMCHLWIVAYAVKKQNIALRDQYADVPVNTVSIAAIIGLLITSFFKIEYIMPALTAVLSVILGVVYCLLFFQYPRILRYWKSPIKQEFSSSYKNGMSKIKKIK